ncbi:PAS domain S-box protein [Bacillus sp. EB600]|nr:PAS domain S-box protein [Bacillus sp. EB600]
MIEISNNDLFMNAFNFSAIGMAIVSMDGRLLKVNASLCKIVDYTAAELEQMTFQNITHPDDLELDLNNLYKMLTEETQYYEMEKRYFKKNGCIVWGLLSVSLVKDENDNPLYFISQIQDRTEQKRIEKELQKSNDRFKAIFEKSGIGIILRDRKGKVVEVNPTYLEMLGYNEEDAAKSTNLIYQDDIGKEKKLFSELINGHRDYYQMEKQFLHKDGHILLVTITVTATRNLEEVYALSMIHDISERKHSEKLIKQSEERYRALVESSPNGIAVHQEGKIVYANPRFIRFLNATSEDDIIGQHILQFVHPDYQEIVKVRI